MPDTDNDPPDLYSLYADQRAPLPDALLRARALAAALRRQQAAGALATLTGDSAATGLGEELFRNAQRTQDQMAGAGKFRQEESGPGAQALGREAGTAPLSPTAADALARLRMAGLGKFGVNSVTGETYNTRNGQVIRAPLGPDGKPRDVRVERQRQEQLNRIGSPPAGWEWDPRIESGQLRPPNMDEVKKANDITSAAGTILDLAEPIRDFLQQHPHGALAGKDAAAVEPFVQGLMVMARKANDMGVYRAYDKPILDKIIQDPTSIRSILGDVTDIRPLKTQLEAFLKETQQRAFSLNQQIHRAPEGTYSGGEQSGRWAGFNARTGGGRSNPTARVRYKGQLLDIPASRLQDALDDGAEEVKQ